MFDANAFVQAAVDPLSTQFEVVPEGEWQMMIDSDPKQLADTTDDNKAPVGIKRHAGTSEKTGKAYDFYDWTLMCVVTDQRVRDKLKREGVKVRMRLSLDLSDSGGLDTGPNKNVALGRLREALNQNKPGWTPQALLGAGPFIGKVSHTQVKDAIYADVTRAARIS
jgi:hypothetical protein